MCVHDALQQTAIAFMHVQCFQDWLHQDPKHNNVATEINEWMDGSMDEWIDGWMDANGTFHLALYN